MGLPQFKAKGTESPYLTFPVWFEQWNKMIVDYPEEYRAVVLMKNIDEEAKKKIISLENDYPAALKKLETFFWKQKG